MLRYLKDAFWYSPRIPGLGRLPWNVLALACIAILGFGNPGFWFLGAGLEGLYLLIVSTNPRFKRLLHAQDAAVLEEDMARQMQRLIQQLPPDSRARFLQLTEKRARILQLHQSTNAEAYLVQSNEQAMRELAWVYLKLLVAQNTLESPQSRATESSLRGQIAALERELQQQDLSPSLRESKSATLKILQKRLENFARREQSLKEIESDLTRVDAQIDLAIENAQMQGRPQAISTNIELASHLLDEGAFGESEGTIHDLDEKLKRTRAAEDRVRQRATA